MERSTVSLASARSWAGSSPRATLPRSSRAHAPGLVRGDAAEASEGDVFGGGRVICLPYPALCRRAACVRWGTRLLYLNRFRFAYGDRAVEDNAREKRREIRWLTLVGKTRSHLCREDDS